MFFLIIFRSKQCYVVWGTLEINLDKPADQISIENFYDEGKCFAPTWPNLEMEKENWIWERIFVVAVAVQATLVIWWIFYVRICVFTLAKMFKIGNFPVKMDLLSTITRYAVQNDGTYLPWITRETCIEDSGYSVYFWIVILIFQRNLSITKH